MDQNRKANGTVVLGIESNSPKVENEHRAETTLKMEENEIKENITAKLKLKEEEVKELNEKLTIDKKKIIDI